MGPLGAVKWILGVIQHLLEGTDPVFDAIKADKVQLQFQALIRKAFQPAKFKLHLREGRDILHHLPLRLQGKDGFLDGSYFGGSCLLLAGLIIGYGVIKVLNGIQRTNLSGPF